MSRLASLSQAFLLACLATACDQVDGSSTRSSQLPGDSASGLQEPLQSESWLDAIENAPFSVEYRGIRRVRASYPQSTHYDYREDVGSDGLGEFAIEPLEMLSAHPDAEFFLLLRNTQQVFDYRYRDFRILDSLLFQSGYSYTVDQEGTLVAGRTCYHLTVQRAEPFVGGYYEVDVDTLTSLVLQWKEFGPNGNLLAHVEFESIDFDDPDLTGLDLTSGFLVTTELDITSSLTESVGFQVLIPSLPPTGFELHSATLLEQPTGEVWVSQLFTDGLERAWLLHAPQSGTSGGGSADNLVHSYTRGAWTVVAGEIDGYQVMAAGRVRKAQLMDMLNSSMP